MTRERFPESIQSLLYLKKRWQIETRWTKFTGKPLSVQQLFVAALVLLLQIGLYRSLISHGEPHFHAKFANGESPTPP
jgi:hypothetical protein